MAEHFLKEAVKRPGAFTKKAQAHGMGVAQYANAVMKPGSKASTLTKQQANYAKVATRIAKKHKKKT